MNGHTTIAGAAAALLTVAAARPLAAWARVGCRPDAG